MANEAVAADKENDPGPPEMAVHLKPVDGMGRQGRILVPPGFGKGLQEEADLAQERG